MFVPSPLLVLNVGNRPRSIYQYSSMAPRLSGQNCKFLKFLLSLNSQRRLGYKENNTKYRRETRKPRAHVRILIYRTWPIVPILLSLYKRTHSTVEACARWSASSKMCFNCGNKLIAKWIRDTSSNVLHAPTVPDT